MSQESVKIEERLLHRIGVREWGWPTLIMPGKVWRSEKHSTITCLVDAGENTVRAETRNLEVLEAGEKSVMPIEWRRAMWEYVQAHPSSGCGLGPFLAITKEERCDFIRKLAAELVTADDIGCRSIANDIGEFAAYGYELVNE